MILETFPKCRLRFFGVNITGDKINKELMQNFFWKVYPEGI